MGEFWRFSDSHEWRVHPETKNRAMNDPISLITYYDAMGYLYSQQPAKKLPTEEQIARAVSTVQLRLEDDPENVDGTSWFLGNFYELTRLENEDDSPESLMGTSVVSVGVLEDGDSIQLGSTRSMNYEHFDPAIGFRGVVDMPTSVAEAKAWIRKNKS